VQPLSAQTPKPPVAKKAKPKSPSKKSKKGSKDAELEQYFTGGKNGKKVKKGKDGKPLKGGDKVVDIKSIIQSKKSNSASTSPRPTDPANNQGNRPMTIGNKTIVGNVGTAQGFRICVYNGTSRKDALAAKQAFMKTYKDMHSYMRYNTPYYKIVVGDYEDKKSAQNSLKNIVKDFNASFIVPDVVNTKHITIYQKR
jgi:hypothetical protein